MGGEFRDAVFLSEAIAKHSDKVGKDIKFAFY